MLTVVIPTRDRPGQLARTLRDLEKLGADAFDPLGGAEVIIADNRSRFPVTAPGTIAGRIPVRVLHRRTNEAASARNACALAASSQTDGDWLLMLDDDSSPLDAAFVGDLAHAPREVGAVCAEIHLEDGRRESGGLPEVPIGCGVAIRTALFNELGGYDPSFHYYVEEYDLAAKVILSGRRVAFSRSFRVLHRKDDSNRNMDAILRSLVRNNAWVTQRYAPDGVLEWVLDETVTRYRTIAEREGAMSGYTTGLNELRETLPAQRRTPMSDELYDRFTGVSAVRDHLSSALAGSDGPVGCLMPAGAPPGKNVWAVRRVLEELRVETGGDPREASVIVPATISPGPMLDACDAFRRELPGKRVITGWDTARSPIGATV